jgi:hypothetical protein
VRYLAPLVMLALPNLATAAPTAAGGSLSSAASETSQVKPAAERGITAGPMAKPTGTRGYGGSTSKGRPLVRGQRIPDAMRAQMKAQLDARIDKDLTQIRGLRVEAIDLLTKFVNETPREAHEMPEAMMRLGELKWELEREQFLELFRAWESRPENNRRTESATSNRLLGKSRQTSAVAPVRREAKTSCVTRAPSPRRKVQAGQGSASNFSIRDAPSGWTTPGT